MLAWPAVLLSLIPGFDQAGVLTVERFRATFAVFLPLTNWWMNSFLLSWVLVMITGVFMYDCFFFLCSTHTHTLLIPCRNKYDSSLNMLTSNISSVLALWTGWVPALMPGTVGFVPSVPLTTLAILLSLLAIYPTYRYSLQMRDVTEQHSTALANSQVAAEEDVHIVQ